MQFSGAVLVAIFLSSILLKDKCFSAIIADFSLWYVVEIRHGDGELHADHLELVVCEKVGHQLGEGVDVCHPLAAGFLNDSASILNLFCLGPRHIQLTFGLDKQDINSVLVGAKIEYVMFYFLQFFSFLPLTPFVAILL